MQVASGRRFGIRGAGASITPVTSVAQATPGVDDETERYRTTRVRDDAPPSRTGTNAGAIESEPTAPLRVAVANDTACEGGIQ